MSSLESFTTAELARLMGVSTRHVGRLAREGVIMKAGRGKYPPEAVAQYCEFLRRDAHAGPADWQTERARLARIRADLAELELGARRGELLEADLVNEAVISTFTIVRARFLAMPAKMAPRVAGTTDPAICEERIKAEVYAALRELSEPDLEEIAKQGVAA